MEQQKVKLILLVTVFGTIALLAIAAISSVLDQPKNLPPDLQKVMVVHVYDGDTVLLRTGEKLRYIGINTPETHPNPECYGQKATSRNEELVLGKEVYTEKDVSETDKYGRLLRYLWVGDTLINEYLVRHGYAEAKSYPPDTKYQDRLNEAERLAREEGVGLWKECTP